MRGWLFDPGSLSPAASFGLLILRLSAGISMAALHGWGKLTSFGSEAAKFPDPLGIGHAYSMAGAVGAEFFCAVLVAIGLGTRFASLAVAFTMGVAAFLVLENAPWGDKELAVAYLVLFLVPLFTGPGAYSLDASIVGAKRR